jgi:hypothetical protein
MADIFDKIISSKKQDVFDVVAQPSSKKESEFSYAVNNPLTTVKSVGKTLLDFVPYARFLNPETRQEFVKKSIESPLKATGDMLLQDVLPTVGFGAIGKIAGKVPKAIEAGLKFTPLAKRASLAEQAINQGIAGTGKIATGQVGKDIFDKIATPQDDFTKVDTLFNKADEELSQLGKSNLQEKYKSFKRNMIDVSGNIKKELLGKGEQGKQAVMSHDLIAGSHAKAVQEITDAEDIIYKGLSKDETKTLDRIIQARRTIDIGKYKPDVKSPAKPGEYQGWLNTLGEKLPKEKFTDLQKRADNYFNVMRKQVVDLQDNGIITKEQADALVQHEYEPRRFIQYLDPEVPGYTASGKKISISESGIKALQEGSDQVLENNSRLLAGNVIARTKGTIARNQANQDLYKMATENPQNGLVQIFEGADDKIPTGFEKINVMVEGQKKSMLMPSNMAKEWVMNDPVINKKFATWLGWLSGSKILKPMATGVFNPEFVLTNLPRDIAHAWLTTTEYSKHLPVALGQIGKDLLKVAPDVWMKKGRYRSYINEGGGMEFLVHQGKAGKYDINVGRIKEVMGKLGEFSEALTRVALRERAIKNGKSTKEATWIARDYLDFSQGGQMAKAFDQGIPYLNAAIQGTRGVLRAASKDPKTFTYKAAQLGGLASGLYLANKTVNPDAWENVPDVVKAGNFVVTTPIYYKDKDGEKRYLYFSLPKDQGQRALTAGFEGAIQYAMEGKAPTAQMKRAFADSVPIMPENALMPSLSALMTYKTGVDVYSGKKLFPYPLKVKTEKEITPYTNAFFKEFGEITGMSPARTQGATQKIFTYGNIYTSLVGLGVKQLLDSAPEKDKDEINLGIIKSIPFLRKYVKVTPSPKGKQWQAEQQSKIEKNTATYERYLNKKKKAMNQ